MHIRFAAFGLLLAISLPAWGQFLNEGTVDHFSPTGDYFGRGTNARGSTDVAPNELNPEAAKPILNQAPAGVYISIGAERGLLGAILSPNVTHLIQIDQAPEVALYNQINVILLKIAWDLPDFIRLRQSTHGGWLARLAYSGLNAKESGLLRSERIHQVYRQIESEPRLRLTNADYFRNSSYLKDPNLFRKAKQLATEGEIQVLTGSLTDKAILESIAGQLKALGLPVSVLDLGNTWEVKHIGAKGVQKILSALSPVLMDESIVLGTSVDHCEADHLCYWNFHGISVALLRRLEKITRSESAATDLFTLHSRTSPGGLLTSEAQSYFQILRLYLKKTCADLLKIL